jgi:hypothetical protein
MGQVYGVWNTSSATFTDVSSPDLNGSTAGRFVWSLQVNAPNVELIATISSGTWDILVATRIIF